MVALDSIDCVWDRLAGCGFLDTVTMLIKLGADVNARDLTQCTPLQNAAHGTYSALATMPLNGSQGGASGVLDIIICLHPPPYPSSGCKSFAQTTS